MLYFCIFISCILSDSQKTLHNLLTFFNFCVFVFCILCHIFCLIHRRRCSFSSQYSTSVPWAQYAQIPLCKLHKFEILALFCESLHYNSAKWNLCLSWYSCIRKIFPRTLTNPPKVIFWRAKFSLYIRSWMSKYKCPSTDI